MPEMRRFIEDKLVQISELCQKFDVKRLELFGSAARADFDESTSDVDLFIEFKDYAAPSIADQWFGLQEAMEKLLNRRVDLTSSRSTKNPYFLKVANQSRVALYAA